MLFDYRSKYNTVILFVTLLLIPAYSFAQSSQQTQQSVFEFFGTQGANNNDYDTMYCYIGTLGSMVTNPNTGEDFILSNNHVLARSNAGVVGDDIMHVLPQVCKSDSLHVGELFDFVPLQFHPRKLNLIDAAIARITPNVNSDAKIMGADFSSFFYVDATPADAAPGLAVQKTGRTTGFTQSVVAAVGVNVGVQYDPKVAYFTDQILINDAGFSAGGDSGSLIVTVDTVDVDGLVHSPVGLLFAGSSTTTIANPIQAVLDAFGVEFGTSGDPGVDELTSGGGGSPGKGKPPKTKSTGNQNAAIELAKAARDRAEDRLMNISGVVGTGIGVAAQGQGLAIQVYVENITPKMRALIPGNIENYPVTLVETGKIVAF